MKYKVSGIVAVEIEAEKKTARKRSGCWTKR